MRIIGEVTSKSDRDVEWKIRDFLSLTDVDERYCSPHFSISGLEWFLSVYPNSRTPDDSPGYVSLYLCKRRLTQAVAACYSLGVKKADGNVQWIASSLPWVFAKGHSAIGEPEFLRRSVLSRRESELAPSSAVTFTCSLKTKTDFESYESVDALSQSFTNCSMSKRSSDAILTVKGREFPVHKTILVARSPVFAAMFEADMRERSTGVVEIPDCDPGTFRTFLLYLYSGRIRYVSGSGDVSELYKIADKYDVQDLKAYCCLCIMTNLSVENVLDAVVFGDTFSEVNTSLKAQTFFNKNLNPILSSAKWDDFFYEHPALANQLFKNMAKETST